MKGSDKMGRFDGKVVLVTGGNRNTGLDLVEKFAREGAKVFMCGSSEASTAKSLAAVVVAVGVAFRLFGADIDFRPPCVVPAPMEMSYQADVAVRLDDAVVFRVACSDAKAVGWVCDKAKAWWGVAGESRFAAAAEDENAQTALPPGEESYALSAKPGRIEISASSLQGVRYAMYTLRQIAERESSGSALKGYWLPALEIKDAPLLAFRGIHLCWWPEMPNGFVERQIRLAAYYKFNCVVLESWGVFKSERHPQFAAKDAPLSVAEAGRLAALASDLGVVIVPQVNVFGHATSARSCTGKHSTLDFHPEMQPLFEPAGGWNWCLSNPDATAVLRDYVDEVHEAFARPPFFHIGCDEADPPSCPKCRASKPYGKLVAAHISSVCDILKKRGARAMMWHDMLIKEGDGRWKGFYAHGTDELDGLIEVIPKDVVVCDWYYGSDPGGQDKTGGETITAQFPTLDYFAASGFDVVTCPWRSVKGIAAQCAYAREKKLFGVLETVWHHFRGTEFSDMAMASANGAWRGGKTGKCGKWTTPFAVHWRQLGWDMDVKDYSATGYYNSQVTREILDR